MAILARNFQYMQRSPRRCPGRCPRQNESAAPAASTLEARLDTALSFP
ncbi:hypothetical protein predicted by Glimmer/Critica [Sorangium cellulosum So ce56]|uniref:Uncharacterized protein n=1 Tax=Sorangium cellulosum (strain So ce56) TaxID=448385 RepID=A9GA03_SORC5|nr:hypothetical protein predicted by Glimmer/Critica [Sorangium cellulosum So ce56]